MVTEKAYKTRTEYFSQFRFTRQHIIICIGLLFVTRFDFVGSSIYNEFFGVWIYTHLYYSFLCIY